MKCLECGARLYVERSPHQPDPEAPYVERGLACRTVGCAGAMKTSEMPTDLAVDQVRKLCKLLFEPVELIRKTPTLPPTS